MPSFLSRLWKNGLLAFVISLTVSACNTQPTQASAQGGTVITSKNATTHQGKSAQDANLLLVVDCLLPGQVRKLGRKFTYLTARRPLKTTAGNCEIRGGEYTSYDRANYATALKIWLPQAQQGNAGAQAYVGEIYEKGLGIQPDYQIAAQWYKKAAEQGNSRAMINLGFLYERGLGVQKDLPTSLNWYRNASGLAGEDLIFASTIEVAEITAYEQQLRDQVNQRDETVRALRTQLQLDEAQRKLARRKANLQRLQQEREKTRRDLEMRKKLQGSGSSHNQQELKRKEKALQQRQARLEEQALLISLRAKGSDKEKVRLNAALQTAQKKQRALQAQLQRSQAETKGYQQQLAQTQKQAKGQQKTLDQAQSEVAKLQREFVRKSKAQGTDNSAELQALQRTLAQQNEKANQQQEEVTRLQVALNEYKNRLAGERQASDRQTNTLENRTHEIETVQQALASKEKQLALAKTQLETREQELATLRAQDRTDQPKDSQPLAQLKQKYKQAAEKTVQMEQDRVRLEKQLQQAKIKEQQLRTALQTSQKNTASYQSKLSDIKAQFEQKKQALTSTEDRLEATQSRFTKESQASATATAELQALQAQLKQSENRLAHQQAKMASLQAKQQGQQATLQKDLLAAQTKEQQQQAELQQRQQEVSTLRQDVSDTREKNVQIKSRLIKREKELQQARTKMAEERQAFKQRLARQSTAAGEWNRLEMQRMEALGKKQKVEIEKQKQRIAQLEQDNARRRTPAKQPEAILIQRQQDLGGPIIELIDPPLVATRGSSRLGVRLRSIVSEREIIGKASAPAGLLTLNVNDRKISVDAAGIFTSSIPVLQGKETPVSIVALDKRGKRSLLEFSLIPSDTKIVSTPVKKSTASAPISSGGINFGKYYALVIGNNNYQHLEPLKTAKNDARVVADLLETRYGFDVTLLTDANRYAILELLNKFREELTDTDNLLLYYAGHGELDTTNLRGYWLPVDAQKDSNTNWISNDNVTDILNTMKAKHILVVVDSCYSGALSRTSIARLDNEIPAEAKKKWFKIMARTRSRTVLTSGGLAPILDSGGGSHSIFARAFIDVLRSNQQILEGQGLYRKLFNRVSTVSARLGVEQNPQYAPIRHAGHEAGEFFFSPSGQASIPLELQLVQRTTLLSVAAGF